MEDRFGLIYRVDYEDDDARLTRDCWRLLLRCEYGDIGPAGGSTLIASTNSEYNAATKALTVPDGNLSRDAGGGRVQQRRLRDGVPGELVADGSDGVSVVFDVKDVAFFLKVMKAKPRGN